MARVCVVGSLMYDLVVRTSRMPRPGETVMGSGFATFLGGKGFNQAVAARRAGADVTLVGRVGDDDFGRRFHAHLEIEGIDALVGTDPSEPTGVGLPVVDESSGQNAIVVAPGANTTLRPSHVESARRHIAEADVLLVQLEVPIDSVAAAARIAAENATAVVLNPAPAAPLPADLGGVVDILVPNEHEAYALGGELPAGIRSAEAVRRSTGARTVVLTMAERGGVVVGAAADGAHEWSAYEVDCVDSVAAGDAFCGALCARLADGDPLGGAIATAAAAGALAVTRRGAEPSLPTLDEIAAFLAVRRHG